MAKPPLPIEMLFWIGLFFLWGYLKSEVFKQRPQTLTELKRRISEQIAAIPNQMLVSVMDQFENRLRKCIAYKGRHLQDIIFKTNWKKNGILLVSESFSFFALSIIVFFLFNFKIHPFFMPHPVLFNGYFKLRTIYYAKYSFNLWYNLNS